MVLSDWTFGDDYSTITIQTTSLAPDTSEGTPYVKVTPASPLHKVFIFPTNNTINGTSVLGINSGQVSWWFKTALNSVGQQQKFFFRVLDTLTASQLAPPNDCYYVVLNDTNGALIRVIGGSVVNLGASFTGLANTSNVWRQIRVSWWESAGSLYVKTEKRSLSTDAWAQCGTTFVEPGNNHKSSTNTIAFSNDFTAYSLEGIRISRIVSA